MNIIIRSFYKLIKKPVPVTKATAFYIFERANGRYGLVYTKNDIISIPEEWIRSQYDTLSVLRKQRPLPKSKGVKKSMNKLNSQKIEKLPRLVGTEDSIINAMLITYKDFVVHIDKINEIIDHLNSQGVKREKKKGVSKSTQEKILETLKPSKVNDYWFKKYYKKKGAKDERR